MTTTTNLVTGATGLLGSHLVEQLLKRGEHVRALVRAGSDTTFLKSLGVELVVGDLNEPASLPAVVAGADIVFHCAAQVGDWGPWRVFRQAIIETTSNLVEACRTAGVGRFLHVSSSRVYGHPRRRDVALAEDEPLGQRLWWLWDYYPRAKIAAEEPVRAYPKPWTIIRPTWIYGPRDRNTVPRIISALQHGQVGLVGSGESPVPMVHARDVAECAILAANSPAAIGQVYNVSSSEAFTQRQLYSSLTAALGIPPLERSYPFAFAFALGFTVEVVGKLLRVKRPLRITRHGVSLMARSAPLSSAKAQRELGWVAQVQPQDGLKQTVASYFGEAGSTNAAQNSEPAESHGNPKS
jgi:nucleoside-diphosphate-sugar epimerase